MRWLAAGTAARFVLRRVVRRTAGRSVDRATADLEERLPQPVRKALDVVPDRAIRAGGSAVVAGRTARRVAVGTKRATRMAADGRTRASDRVGRLRSIGDDIARETEDSRRRLKAEYVRATRGPEAADDVLLDLRRSEEDSWSDDEPPEVMDPVRRGRWRAERRLGSGAVNRVRRSYQKPTKPWDR